jgi:hypothetical protein
VDTEHKPTAKVTAAAVGGATAAIVAWLLSAFAGVEAPPGIEAAFATVFAFLAGYFTTERAG